MKKSGVVRHIDRLGRCVIPMEMRRVLGIRDDDPLEITREGNAIIITKFTEACIICGAQSGLSDFKGKKLCASCVAEISSK